MNIQQKYLKTISKAFTKNGSGYRPIWKPNRTIKIGDYGLFDKTGFNVVGNIRNLFENDKIPKSLSDEPRKSGKIVEPYYSGEISFSRVEANAQIPSNEIKFSLEFMSKNTVVFSPIECIEYEIIEKQSLAWDVINRLLELNMLSKHADGRKWDLKYRIVLGLVNSPQGVYTISTEKGRKLEALGELDDNASIEDLLSGRIQVKNHYSSNQTYSATISEPHTPLISRTCYINSYRRPKPIFKGANSHKPDKYFLESTKPLDKLPEDESHPEEVFVMVEDDLSDSF